MQTLKKERGGLAERLVNLQNQIFRQNEKIDQFKARCFFYLEADTRQCITRLKAAGLCHGRGLILVSYPWPVLQTAGSPSHNQQARRC